MAVSHTLLQITRLFEVALGERPSCSPRVASSSARPRTGDAQALP
jgi:hypothetical protein